MNLTDLKRYPERKKELLQAWDSADELILKHLKETELPNKGKRILILGDQFGALSCALAELAVTSYTDSFLSFKAIQLNSKERVQPISQLGEMTGIYDLVLIRVPKNMSFFEDMLCQLSAHLGADSKVICGYMVKHQAKASFELLNKYIGETTTSLAQKKARLIFASFQRAPATSPYPIQVPIEGFKTPFTHHSNLFSREKLDIGTRFLLENLPKGKFPTILDLGCGNGLVGIAAKRLNPSSKLIFTDESQMAIQSAKLNFTNYFPGEKAEFHWTNCFEDARPGSVDLVLCNPPFHQGNALGDQIAWQMFRDSHRALSIKGTIRVIGNTHLKYQTVLKRVFGNSRLVATNSKFMIVDAVKTPSSP
jgi:23S rRNA (guanine1835-N2)-methyltransferase